MHQDPAGQGLTLVTGATGKTGRRVAQRLQALDAPSGSGPEARTRLRLGESGDMAGGARRRRVGLHHLLPGPAVPGAFETVRAFAAAAGEAGVRRLVLLSGRGEPAAQRAEQAVTGAGCEWTVVRASWFDQNFSEDFLLPTVLDGVIMLPAAPDVTRAVRRSRGRRRRRGGRAHAAGPPRADLRGDRPAVVDLRRCRGRADARHGSADLVRARPGRRLRRARSGQRRAG